MNKINKITLPTISPNIDKSEHGKRKIFRGWMMNDTFSNWHKKKQIHNISPKQSSILFENQDIQLKDHVNSKSKLTTGITLGQYFRTRSNTQLSCNQQYHVPEQDILPYLNENFEINQADEDNYQQSQNCLQISNHQIIKPKQQIIQQNSLQTKVKTEYDEHNTHIITPMAKKNGLHSQKSREKIQPFNKMQQSFDFKPRSKNRSISNQVSKKFKGSQSIRKNTILQRTKADKFRASQFNNIQTNLYTKYAQKFHLQDRQKIKIGRQHQ